ncbi:MAG: hypothetical protein ACP5QO_17985, partial [Clostridia bacterium]
MKTRRAAHGPPSTLAQIGYLARRMPGLLAVLTLASVVAGLVESGILAVLAESALLLADGRRSLSVHAGPLHLDASIGLLVLIGVGLACLRLALGALLSFVPARITANTQAELRTRLFRSFAGASWSVQSRDREGLFQELITNHVGQAVGVFMSSAQLITAVVTFLALVASAVALSPLAALGIIVVVAAVSAALRPLSNLGQRRS